MTALLKIGISACLLHPDPARDAYAPKTLQYIEQSTAQWVRSGGALPVMVPALVKDAGSLTDAFADYAQWLDGLVLHGGADVWPGHYGETALEPHWAGDRTRDDYEKALVKAFVAAGKPVFGVCRGLQLINVAFGGTLYQDIPTQQPQAARHRDHGAFDMNFHQVEIVAETRLGSLLMNAKSHKINSIHHQGIKDLAPGFVVEARCPEDGMVEAIRRTGPGFVAAVQWHPEFHHADLGSLDDTPVLLDFLAAARHARTTQNPTGAGSTT